MLKIMILSLILPLTIVCFLFCKYNFFKIYVQQIKTQLLLDCFFYFFLASFCFVTTSFTFLYFGIFCFQFSIAISAFFNDGKLRGYCCFIVVAVTLVLIQFINGTETISSILTVLLLMIISIVFCELTDFLIAINRQQKYAISVVIINLITVEKVNKSNLFTSVYHNSVSYLAILVGSIISLYFVRLYAEKFRQRQSIISKLKREANYDALTNLLNYNSFAKYMGTVREGIDLHYVVAMLDIDFFKLINDHYGHLVGNSAIRFFSANLRSFLDEHLKNKVEVYRFGGEEFCLLFRDTDISDCFENILKFQEQLSNNIFYTDDNQAIRLKFSGGLAETDELNDLGDAVQNADLALYAAKESGRSQIVCPDFKV